MRRGASMLRVTGPGQTLLRLGMDRGNRTAILASSLLTVSLLLSFGARPASAQCTLTGSPATWSVGSSSNWNTPTNWSTGTVPNSSGINVCITDGSSTVTLDTNAQVASLQLASGNTLSINSGRTLTENGPGLTNAGVITINDGSAVNITGSVVNSGTISVIDTGDGAALQLFGDTTLSGGGTITLSSSATNSAYLTNYPFTSSDPTLTNQNDVIQGSGDIGNHLIVINEGTIDANVAAGTLSITTDGFTNTGTLQASNGGILSIQSSINNVGGTISSSSGSTVDLLNLGAGTTIYGGTLNSNGGTMVGANITLDGSTFGALTNTGTFTVGEGSTVNITGSIINQPTIIGQPSIAIAAVNDQTVLNASGNVTLTGGGSVVLSTTGSGTATLSGSSTTLTNVDNTIEGAGEIGGNRGLSIINQTLGTIDANTAGQQLLLFTSSFTNTGTLEATNGGILAIQSVINNQGGEIVANGSGSSVFLNQNHATIQGGTLSTQNGGTIGSSGAVSVTLDGSTFGAITNLGTFTVNDNGNVSIVGSIVNQGTISIASVNNGATLGVNQNASATLTGGGTLVLSTTGTNVATLNGNSSTLTNVDNTIEGAGEIGGNHGLSIINQSLGTIDANTVGQQLLLYTGTFTNTGTLEATNGGILAIQSTINNQNGTIVANGGGSSVVLNGNNGSIQGGTLNTTGGGTMGSSVGVTGILLDGSTHGALTNAGTFNVADASQVNLVGSIVNSGTFFVNDTGDGANLQIFGDTMLTGGGTITLSSSATNSAYIADSSWPALHPNERRQFDSGSGEYRRKFRYRRGQRGNDRCQCRSRHAEYYYQFVHKHELTGSDQWRHAYHSIEH